MIELAVAGIAVCGVLGAPVVTGWMQRRVQRENRYDHAKVWSAITDLTGEVGEMRGDVRGLHNAHKEHLRTYHSPLERTE